MRAILVDDEPLALESLCFKMKSVPVLTEIAAFSDTDQALAHLAAHGADVAFLDMEMGETDGLSLSMRFKELCPACAILFVTGYSQYASNGFGAAMPGYLLKPVTPADIEAQLSSLGHLSPPVSGGARLRVRCFGRFEVFSRDRKVQFAGNRDKELLAYLVDRKGAQVPAQALANALWGDVPGVVARRARLSRSAGDLMRSLRSVGAGDVLVRRFGSLGVAAERFDCDYYSYLRYEPWAVNSFAGAYMTGYPWAEMTLGRLYTASGSVVDEDAFSGRR